jgi:hypothetical protein
MDEVNRIADAAQVNEQLVKMRFEESRDKKQYEQGISPAPGKKAAHQRVAFVTEVGRDEKPDEDEKKKAAGDAEKLAVGQASLSVHIEEIARDAGHEHPEPAKGKPMFEEQRQPDAGNQKYTGEQPKIFPIPMKIEKEHE